mgnify:CR=1 FL=1
MLIASLGGVELVLSALRNHTSHVGVQEMGFSALQNLAMNGWLWAWWLLSEVCDDVTSTMTDESRVLIASLSGVE